jgi:signal transducing adaptor molecule
VCSSSGYVQEPFPETTPAELAAETQQEAVVSSQAANVDLLLTMLHALDPAKDNLFDNEEIQGLYGSCMSHRMKIVKLIDQYGRKRGMLSCVKKGGSYELTISFPCLQLT